MNPVKLGVIGLALVICTALSGCEAMQRFADGYHEAQAQQEAQQEAQREAFQRDWDAMTPEQRMQYRLAQQQLAAQQQQATDAARAAAYAAQLQAIQNANQPLRGSQNCTSYVSGNTIQTRCN
jgi:hypothetical protein